jgi:hypothetical protein
MHLRVAERRGNHVLGRPFHVSEEVDISLLHFVLFALEKGGPTADPALGCAGIPKKLL